MHTQSTPSSSNLVFDFDVVRTFRIIFAETVCPRRITSMMHRVPTPNASFRPNMCTEQEFEVDFVHQYHELRGRKHQSSGFVSLPIELRGSL